MNTNPCENCGYHWQENWESFPSCHYEGPSAWAPCEAEETAKRDELERREYEEEIRAMCEDYEREVAKLSRRAEVVRAMELIARCINDEEIFESWLIDGVADGDITEDTTDEDLEYYCEDDNFAELMELFLRLMARAKKDGGLYCDGVVSGSNC